MRKPRMTALGIAAGRAFAINSTSADLPVIPHSLA
jgi:hypothetical protein